MTGDRRARLGRAMIGHLPALRRYAVGLSGSIAAADDLVQDCIEHGLRRLDSLEDEARLAGWLRRILFAVHVDDHRHWRSRVRTFEPELLGTMVDQAADPDTREELAQTVRAMAGLTVQHRQVLLLVGVEGLSYREVADEIGVPIGTVMSRLARARAELREALRSDALPAAGSPT